MRAHVLLNLLNKLRRRDKMRGLPSILSLFHNKFDKFNHSRARMLESIYHMALRLLQNLISVVKNVMILSLCRQPCCDYGSYNIPRKSTTTGWSISLHGVISLPDVSHMISCHICPSRTHVSLCIHSLWSDSSTWTLWVTRFQRFFRWKLRLSRQVGYSDIFIYLFDKVVSWYILAIYFSKCWQSALYPTSF